MLKTFWSRFYTIATPMYVTCVFMPFILFVPLAILLGCGREDKVGWYTGYLSDRTVYTAILVSVLLGVVAYTLWARLV